MNDDMRHQLRRLDPMHPGVPLAPIPDARLERIMSHTTPGPAPSRQSAPLRLAAIGAVGVAAVVLAVALGPGLLGGGSTPLALTGGGDDPMAMCLPVDAAVLAPIPVAFEGTVTSVDGESVTLRIDTWFAGDTGAEEAIVTAPAGFEALIGGVAFEVGQTHLVAAADGEVQYCGLSGPATPELRAIYDQAFGG